MKEIFRSPIEVAEEFDEAMRDDGAYNHPYHYNSSNGLEVIDCIEAFTSDLSGVEAFDAGNVIKYICRWKNKNGIEDLRKAAWYLDHLINHVEEN